MTEIIRVSSFLRYVLFADAATCLSCGLLLSVGGGYLQDLLGLPAQLMLYAGLGLFPFAALLVFAALRRSVSKTLVWLIVGLNLLWTIDSFLLLASGYVAPTVFGYIFVVFQALGVALFAELEFIGLRKAEVIGFENAEETV
jgi:hypothetical protein